MNGSLNFPNFDAGISKIELKPKNIGTKVVFSVRQYDPALEKNRNYRLTFNRVAAADFRINYFDNLIGAEAMGLYELTDPDLKEKLTRDIFLHRREVYLTEGDYDYVEDEPHDMLNCFDLSGDYKRMLPELRLFVQNVDGGVYMILAASFEITEK